MRTKLLIIGYLLLAIWLTGCTITKRVHRGGYHIEWHKRYNNDINTNENDRTNQFQTAPDSEILAKDFVLDEIENRKYTLPIADIEKAIIYSITQTLKS